MNDFKIGASVPTMSDDDGSQEEQRSNDADKNEYSSNN